MQVPPATATASPFSLEAFLALALVVLAAGVMALCAGMVTRRILKRIEGDRAYTQPIAKTTVRAVRRVTFVISLLALVVPALEVAGVNIGAGLEARDITTWASQSGTRILLLILLAFAANRFAASVILRAEDDLVAGDDPRSFERRKRAQTLGSTLRRFVSVVIFTATSLMVLRELDVDITPVLTGAGIIGLAVGFGAQTLVKDIISGMFLIIEDQIRIGDVAEINGIGGAVEEINLRTVVLRDIEGVVHTISNGDIRTVANRSKDFSYYVIDLAVGYDDDTDRIVEIVRATAGEQMADPAYAASILEPIEVLGVDNFKPTEVTLRFRIKTMPLKQAEVGRELRRRIRKRLAAEGIRVPTPQMQVTIKQ